MAKDNRIEESKFERQTFDTASAGATVYSDYSINGDILEVHAKFNQAGSLSVAISGTNSNIWSNNNSSGADFTKFYPRVFSQSNTGSIANANHVPFIANGPLVLTIGSVAASGTDANVDVSVFYR